MAAQMQQTYFITPANGIMKKFIRHAGSNTNITTTMNMQRQICIHRTLYKILKVKY